MRTETASHGGTCGSNRSTSQASGTESMRRRLTGRLQKRGGGVDGAARLREGIEVCVNRIHLPLGLILGHRGVGY